MPLFIGIHGSSTCSLVNNGGHRLQLIQQWWLSIVNGWCQPFAAHAMATTQQVVGTETSQCILLKTKQKKRVIFALDVYVSSPARH
jgi:hypothetical protein